MNSKLKCDCENDVYDGIPCRHQIAIYLKRKISFDCLPFNPRWEKAFFQDIPELALQQIEEEKEVVCLLFNFNLF